MEGFLEDAASPRLFTERGAGGEGKYPDFRATLDE